MPFYDDIKSDVIYGTVGTTNKNKWYDVTMDDLESAYTQFKPAKSKYKNKYVSFKQEYLIDKKNFILQDSDKYMIKTGNWLSEDKHNSRMFENWYTNNLSHKNDYWITTDIGTSGSTTTFNAVITPPPRRIGGIYKIKSRKRQFLRAGAPNEEKARRLLQRLIGFQRFARYIRDGFVTYRGKSGKVYQIFPGMAHMRVWMNGQRVEDLCLCIRDYDIPPTDSIVMRLLMLEHSEEEFRAQANVHRIRTGMGGLTPNNHTVVIGAVA